MTWDLTCAVWAFCAPGGPAGGPGGRNIHVRHSLQNGILSLVLFPCQESSTVTKALAKYVLHFNLEGMKVSLISLPAAPWDWWWAVTASLLTGRTFSQN